MNRKRRVLRPRNTDENKIQTRTRVIAGQLSLKFSGFCDEAKRVAVFYLFFLFNILLAFPKNPPVTKKKLLKKPSNRWYWYRVKAD
jgi:hypothetical protein